MSERPIRATTTGKGMEPSHPSTEEARARARRQLRQLLGLLALLDTTVLVVVVGLAIAWSRFHLPTLDFLALVFVTVGTVIVARVALGVRLKRRSGNL